MLLLSLSLPYHIFGIGTNKLIVVQSRRCIRCGILSNVDMDPIYMVTDQRLGINSIVILYPRRSMNDAKPQRYIQPYQNIQDPILQQVLLNSVQST